MTGTKKKKKIQIKTLCCGFYHITYLIKRHLRTLASLLRHHNMAKQSTPLFHPLTACSGHSSSSTVTADQAPHVRVRFALIPGFQTSEIRRGHISLERPSKLPRLAFWNSQVPIMWFCLPWFYQKISTTVFLSTIKCDSDATGSLTKQHLLL